MGEKVKKKGVKTLKRGKNYRKPGKYAAECGKVEQIFNRAIPPPLYPSSDTTPGLENLSGTVLQKQKGQMFVSL